MMIFCNLLKSILSETYSLQNTLRQLPLLLFAGSILLNFLQEALTTHTNGCFAECFLSGDFRARSHNATRSGTYCHGCSLANYSNASLRETADIHACFLHSIGQSLRRIRLSTSPRNGLTRERLEVLRLVGGGDACAEKTSMYVSVLLRIMF